MTAANIFRRLRADHRRVMRDLDALERSNPGFRGSPAPARRRAIGLRSGALRATLAHLDRQFATHMAAEDESLFPALAASLPEARPGLEPLKAEHVELRAMLTNLLALLDRPASAARDEQIVVVWRDFSVLLRIHIRKEEALVFNVAEPLLPPRALARMEAIRFPTGAPRRAPSDTRPAKGSSLMKRQLVAVLALACAFSLGSCGAKSSDSSSASGGSTPAAAPASGGTVAAVSKYDAGPRAGEQPIDEARVAEGAGLFKSKGCTACHAFGKRLTCPDLAGVTMRRTAAWMENQILHPDVMVKEDPISHGLFATYALQMPNQGLTPDQAKAVVEFFKETDHEAHEKSASH